MKKYNDVDRLFDEIQTKLIAFSEETKVLLDDETSSAMKDAYKEFGTVQQYKIKEIFKDAVDEFYDAYDPTTYSRKHSLYNLLEMQLDNDGMAMTSSPTYMDLFNQNKMTKDRRGGNSLFQTVFVEGWHGGAKSISSSKERVWGKHPSPGIPHYRRGGFVKLKGTSRFWHKYGRWGRQAVRSESAHHIFFETYKVAESGELAVAFQDISTRHNNDAVNRVANKTKKIFDSIYGK